MGYSSQLNFANTQYCHVKTRNNATYDHVWEQRYKELVAFRKKHGHTSVPQRYGPNIALGKWVHSQRYQLKKKLNREPSYLTQHRYEALTSINFNINPKNSSDGSWRKRYKELVLFKQLHGNCKVPQKYSENPSLGRWVHKQRHDLLRIQVQTDYHANDLMKQRIAALNKIGFDWSLRLR